MANEQPPLHPDRAQPLEGTGQGEPQQPPPVEGAIQPPEAIASSGDARDLVVVQEALERLRRIVSPPFPTDQMKLEVSFVHEHYWISVDGVPYTVKLEEALFIRVLMEARGHWLSLAQAIEVSGLLGPRPDRVLGRLVNRVKPLAKYIEKSHRGYRVRGEALE